jgi:hypothetical protein
MLPRWKKRVVSATFQKAELKITVLSASPAALAVTRRDAGLRVRVADIALAKRLGLEPGEHYFCVSM